MRVTDNVGSIDNCFRIDIVPGANGPDPLVTLLIVPL
jgi:hypothetical protein